MRRWIRRARYSGHYSWPRQSPAHITLARHFMAGTAGGGRISSAAVCACCTFEEGDSPPAPARMICRMCFGFTLGRQDCFALGFVDFPLLAFHFQKNSLVKPAVIPLLYAGAMGVIGLTALIFGRLFDRYGIQIIVIGIIVSLLALPFGFLVGGAGVYISMACWATGHGAQDATLRSGISQVVSMNKRGTAFGAFNAAYGVLWFLGSVTMGVLYDFSLFALVGFGMVAQLAAAVLFIWLRKPLASQKAANRVC